MVYLLPDLRTETRFVLRFLVFRLTVFRLPANLAAFLLDLQEALKLLKTVKTSNDDLGDVDWFATSDGKASFGWLGGPRALIDAASAEGSSSYGIFGCKIIPNDVPEAVVQLLADRII